jgi:hypothetical protein
VLYSWSIPYQKRKRENEREKKDEKKNGREKKHCY